MTRIQDYWKQCEIWKSSVNLYNMELLYGQELPSGAIARIKIYVALLRATPLYDVIQRYKIGAMIRNECHRAKMLKHHFVNSRKWN